MADLITKDVFKFEPLKENRFLVNYMDIPEWLVTRFSYGKNYCTCFFREGEGYSAEEYLRTRKKYDKTLIVRYLNPCGVVVRADTFKGVKVKEIGGSNLNYDEDEIIESWVSFSFKSMTIEINGGNKIGNATAD